MEKDTYPQSDAWAETVKLGFQEVKVEPQFRSKSAPDMCTKSTDEGRHHWYLIAVGSQSIEKLGCGFCEETLYD